MGSGLMHMSFDHIEENRDISPLGANFMPRPRVDRIFDKATRSNLVYVIAGAGCGKTQAVHHYIKQQTDAVVRWMHLSESDNIGSRYWESLTHNISLDNPELAAKLRELGFPDTGARFKQFAGIVRAYEHKSRKTFFVQDDFHSIHSEQVLAFAERCAHLHIPGVCEIFISRKAPEINDISLFSKGKISVIDEDDLRFRDDEISDLLKQSKISFSAGDLPRISESTKGWALAVKLLSLVLTRTQQRLDCALTTMKQNVFKLFETETFGDFPDSVKKSLVQLSLVSSLPQAPLNEIFGDFSFAQYAPKLTSFVWLDSFIGEYRIHPLFLEFLEAKQDMLTSEEHLDIYDRAARWCSENDRYMDAISYFAKARQFGRLLELMLTYPFKLPPDTCGYILDILEGITPDNGGDDPNVVLLKALFIPRLHVGMGRFEDAAEYPRKAIQEMAGQDEPTAHYLRYIAYNNLAYIDTYTCTATHKYDFLQHLRSAVEGFLHTVVTPADIKGPFGVAEVRSFACLVGEGATVGEFDQFLESSIGAASYLEQCHHAMYWGYDDLVACEIAYFKNQLDIAGRHAHNAIMKAREMKQHSIEAMAQHYLLRIAMHEGDYPLTSEMLKQLRDHLDNPDFWNRQLLYDLFVGSFYIHIGLPGMAPSWLAIDEKDADSEIHIPTRELFVGVRYHIAAKKYKQALAILCNSYPREPQERFYFGELTFLLLFAVTRFMTGDVDGAVADFTKAYEASFGGLFEMPFIELSKSFHVLASAARERGSGGIPEKWLAATERKASIYAKKAAVISNSFKRAQKLKDNVVLSEREREVLQDLYHGLSREEIAENRHLSINTVKTVLRSVFIKLGAYNNVDAIRIAIEKRLID